MKDFGVFDILGPIMVGPSSSHTAGAARLGRIAGDMVPDDFYEVDFYLHGSFGKTYSGHGTDKALMAGILGMDPADVRLKDSLEIADARNLKYKFIERDLGYHHPNTVKIVFKFPHSEDFYIIGSSIGGGSIVITDINGSKVEFSGDYPTLFIRYMDKKGVISKISSLLSSNDINIATMKVNRDRSIATMVIETDTILSDDMIREINGIGQTLYINGTNPGRR
jgi:L-serine dehydratase